MNQLTVTEFGRTRRPDVVVFVNGLPLAVIELKNAAAENATIWGAFQQIQTYKAELPAFFVFNEIVVVSDGIEARIGTMSSDRERFLPWRTIEGETLAPATMSQLEVLLRGVFDKRRLLDLIRYFVVYEHIRSKRRREALAKRLKNADDPLKIVLVRDMSGSRISGRAGRCMRRRMARMASRSCPSMSIARGSSRRCAPSRVRRAHRARRARRSGRDTHPALLIGLHRRDARRHARSRAVDECAAPDAAPGVNPGAPTAV